MFNNLNMDELMKQAQKVQEELQKMQEKLATMEVTGEAGAGLVKVVMSGRYEIKDLRIDASLKDESLTTLQDLIKAATNSAVTEVREKIERDGHKTLTDRLGNIGASLSSPDNKTP